MDPNAVGFLTGNLVLNLSILAWAAAQFIKFFLVLITERRLSWSHILSSGGMPSSHSSTVCACASALACLYGTSSPHFAVSTVLAAVVMYDASNVRRAAGEQARLLYYIMVNGSDMQPEVFGKKLKEMLGHTPLQVLMGALLGIIIGWGGAYLFG